MRRKSILILLFSIAIIDSLSQSIKQSNPLEFVFLEIGPDQQRKVKMMKMKDRIDYQETEIQHNEYDSTLIKSFNFRASQYSKSRLIPSTNGFILTQLIVSPFDPKQVIFLESKDEPTNIFPIWNVWYYSLRSGAKELLFTNDNKPFSQSYFMNLVGWCSNMDILIEASHIPNLHNGIWKYNLETHGSSRLGITNSYMSTPIIMSELGLLAYTSTTSALKNEIDGISDEIRLFDLASNEESLIKSVPNTVFRVEGFIQTKKNIDTYVYLSSEFEYRSQRTLAQPSFKFPWPQNASYNPVCVSRIGPSAATCPSTGSSCGIISSNTHTNDAVDFDTPNGVADNIVAVASGTVIQVSNTCCKRDNTNASLAGCPITSASCSGQGWGKYVIIDHGLDVNGSDRHYTVYAHLSQAYVSTGQIVSQGCVIGDGGNTQVPVQSSGAPGNPCCDQPLNSSGHPIGDGDHLHFEYAVGSNLSVALSNRMYATFDEVGCKVRANRAYTSQNTCNSICPTPPNDLCTNAEQLTPSSTCTYVNRTTCGATQSVPATSPCNGFTNGNADDDVWFKFDAIGGQTYTVRLLNGTNFDGVLDLRVGSCNGTSVACDDQTGSTGVLNTVTITPPTSQTYYARVYHYGSGSGSGGGNFQICVIGAGASTATITNFTISPTSVCPTGTFTITNIINATGAISNAILGASIAPTGTTNYIDNSSNDQPVSLPSGTSTRYRNFTVPAGTSPGVYDVVSAVWLDVNNNMAINPGVDVSLNSLTRTGILTISSGPPAQPSTISGNTSPCPGTQSYSVTNVAGVTYNWNVSSGGGTINPSGNTASINWTTPGTYTITVTPSNGCGNGTPRTLSVTVAAGPPAQPSTISGNTSPCPGTQSYSVTNVAGVTYNWNVSSGGGTINPSGNTASINWTTPGTYTITVTPNNGCGNGTPRTLSVTVAAGPPAQPSTISGNTSPCPGTQSYSVTNVAGVTYNWNVSSGGGTINPSGNTASINWTTPGTYTITVTPNNGCGNGTPRTLSVTVAAGPPAQPSTISGNTSPCPGTQSYSVTNVAGVTYNWNVSSGGGTINPSGNTASINWTTPGTYTITVTPSNGCGNGTPRTLSVTVAAGPPAQPSTISGNTSPCPGTQSYSVTNVAGVTYNWNVSSGGGTINPSGNTASINWTTPGTYTITVTPNNGCGNGTPRTLSVTVAAGPPAQPSTISGNTSPCPGTQSYSVTNVAGVTYNWNVSSGGGTINPSGNTASINWTTPGTYTITVTPNNGCGNGTPRTLSVTVAAGPPAQPSTISGNTSPCPGTQSYSVTNVAGVTYNWNVSSGGGTINPSGNTASINWTTPGTYTITVTPSNGCGNGTPRTLSVTVAAGPPAQPSTISGNTSPCPGTQSYSVTNVAGVTYNWNVSSGGGTINPSGNTASVNWTVAGPNTITVTPSNGCGNGTPRTLLVNVDQLPVADAGPDKTICTAISNSTAIGSSPVAGNTYSWSPTTALSNSAIANPTASPSVNTTYTVTVTNSFGCTANDQVIVTLDPSAGCVTAVPNISGLEEFKIIPNPNNGIFNVRIKLNTIKHVSFRLFNLAGQIIYQSETYHLSGTQSKEINGSKLAGGVYFLETKIGKESFVEKVVIIR